MAELTGYRMPVPMPLRDLPGFVKADSGVYVPQDAMIARMEKARKLNRLQTGQFFSDWARLSGYNSTGAMEKPDDEVSFSFLRDAYSRSEIDTLIINRRIQQMRMLSKLCTNPSVSPGWRVVHVRHDDPDFKVTEDIRHRCREVEEVIMNPWEVVHQSGFDSVLAIATREELTVDRKVAILAKDRRGRVRSYWMVDGTSVLPIVEVLYPFWKRNLQDEDAFRNPWSMDWAKVAERASEDKELNPEGFDLTKYAWVQEIDSKIVQAWYADQVSVDIRQSSIWVNKLPFGQGSMLQQSLSLTAAWVNAWQYNQELFRTNIPENLIALFGDYDPQGLESAKRLLFSEAGPASWHRTVLVPADPEFKIQVEKLRESPREAQFLELMKFDIYLKSFAYGMNPKIFNLQDVTGSSRGLGRALMRSPRRPDEDLDEYRDIGAKALIQSISDWIDRAIVKSWYKDLKFVFDGLDRQDERERIEILEKKLNSYMTIDEAREIDNLDPLPNGVGAYPKPIAEAMIKSEADLIEAETEMAVVGQSPDVVLNVPQKKESEASIHRKKDKMADELGIDLRAPEHSDRKPGPGGRPKKPDDEPGTTRRIRDRAKAEIREKTGGVGTPRKMVRQILEERLKRDTGKEPDPKRAKEAEERHRRKG